MLIWAPLPLHHPRLLLQRYLFVGKDEQQGVPQLLLRQQFGELAVGLHQPVSVTAVDHKHHRWTQEELEKVSKRSRRKRSDPPRWIK